MPEKEIRQPRNILEVINENVYNVGEGLRIALVEIATLKDEIARLTTMFNAPEQPNALGGEGASVVSREQ